MNPLFLILFITTIISAHAQRNKEVLYVGTFSVRGSEGIYVLEFDPAAVTLNVIQAVPGLESPAYVEIHPSGKFLYAANRGSVDGVTKKSGSVSAFSIDGQTGKLQAINSQPAFGLGPCHIGIDREGKIAVVSQFHEGTLAVYSLLADGSLGAMTDSIRYSGHGLDAKRQAAPHIHSANFTPDHQFIFVADLGSDKIYSYRSKTVNGKLIPADQPYINTNPGTGPRHISFHPNGKDFYLAEEISSTVGAFTFDSKTGVIKIKEDQMRSLPENFSKENSAADIHISQDGKFLYMSNRGHNALAIYSVAKNGKLSLIGHQDTKGTIPRFHAFNKSGDYLFVANQDSDNIVIFKVNKKTGLLSQTGIDFKLPSPVCIKFLP